MIIIRTMLLFLGPRNDLLKKNFPFIVFKIIFPNLHRERSSPTDEERCVCGWSYRISLHWESDPPTLKHCSSVIFRFSFRILFLLHCTLALSPVKSVSITVNSLVVLIRPFIFLRKVYATGFLPCLSKSKDHTLAKKLMTEVWLLEIGHKETCI